MSRMILYTWPHAPLIELDAHFRSTRCWCGDRAIAQLTRATTIFYCRTHADQLDRLYQRWQGVSW